MCLRLVCVLYWETEKQQQQNQKPTNQPNRKPSAWIKAIAGYQEEGSLDLPLLKSMWLCQGDALKSLDLELLKGWVFYDVNIENLFVV